MDFILKMKEKALKNRKLTMEEGLRLFNSNLEKLIKEANNIRKEIHFLNKFIIKSLLTTIPIR